MPTLIVATPTNLGNVRFSVGDLADRGYLALGSRRRYTDVPLQQVTNINNDGHADLLTTYTEAPYIDWYFNNGSGNLTKFSRVTLGKYGRMVTAAQLNADKMMDMVWREGQDSTIHLLLGEGGNSFRHLRFDGLKAAYFVLHDEVEAEVKYFTRTRLLKVGQAFAISISIKQVPFGIGFPAIVKTGLVLGAIPFDTCDGGGNCI